jgi:hypothetical protein
MWAIGLIVGALIGGSYHGELALLGALLGLAAGLWIGRWRKRVNLQLASLEAQLQALRGDVAASLPSASAVSQPSAAMPSSAREFAAAASDTGSDPVADPMTSAPVAAPATMAADARAALPVRKGGRGVRPAPAGAAGESAFW